MYIIISYQYACPHCLTSLDSDGMALWVAVLSIPHQKILQCISNCFVYTCTWLCNSIVCLSRNIGNHRAILTDAGYTDIREYRYFKKETRGLDYEGMMKDLQVNPSTFITVVLPVLFYLILHNIMSHGFVLCYTCSECTWRFHLHTSRLCSQSNWSWPQQGAMEGHNGCHESKP